jgi:alpha-1,2-mannosyltransferase
MLLSAAVLLVTVSVLAAIVAFAAASALSGSIGASIASAVAAGGLVGWRLRHHPVLRPREPPSRGVRVLSILACLAVIVQLVRLTVFIEDANQPRWSVAPWNAWIVGHSCVTAYWTSGREVRTMPDLYADASAARTEPGVRPAPRKLGPLYLDVYEYPPTFLLLPRVLMRAAPDFFDFRRLWYALNLAVVGIGLVAIARRLEGVAGSSVLWLSAVVLAPPAITSTLQIGNVQLACIALAMLGMLAMEEDAHPVALPLGALGLALATVSKLYPGVLVVYLLARRRWRAFGWTAAWGVLLGLIGLADLGLAPHRAFVEHLPRLLSGEAFAALANPRGVSGNMSVPGLVFKLGVVYGVPGMSYTAARVVGWLYTLATVALALRLAWRPLPRAWEPAAWLAILIAATLRSPLLPPYGAFAPLWLAVVYLAARWNEPRERRVAIAMALVFTPVNAAQTLLPPSVHAIVTTVQTAVALVLVVMTVRMGAVSPRPHSP